MRRSFLIWMTISVLAFVGAAVFWQLGERRREQPAPPAPTVPAASNTAATPVRSPSSVAAAVFAMRAAEDRATRELAAAEEAKKRFPHQLTNSRRHLGQLLRSDTALLLQNALIETTEGTALPIPAHLRAGGDPGAYLVQSRGPVNDHFRRALTSAGAQVVAYIPHHAYLVRATSAAAQVLATQPGTQAVLPYEPYYKLQADLLARAVEDQPLPEAAMLRVTGYPGEGGVLRTVLAAAGAELLLEERSPFGPQFIIQPPADALVLLAQSPSVQGIEPYDRRALLNDLSRLRLGIVSDTSLAAPNYPVSNPLTGTGITLNLNDSGVDGTHLDLTPRVTTDLSLAPSPLLDPIGHGTHVAGTIISSGANGTIGTNATGSTNMANMRGLAFNASLYVLPLDVTNGPAVTGLSDFFLQTNAANHNYSTLTRTNPMVSNNSWGYLFSRGYDSSSASFDAAVRDALPEQLGMQPLIFVFAVGNEGFGADNGLGGFADSIVSPATSKNGISVGAVENARLITNTVVTTNLVEDIMVVTNLTSTNFVLVTNIVFVTNAIFLPLTDNPRQVASFSSRGNVDPGLEGLYGRFKPDVVAPGTFTVSTRSAQFTNDLTTPVGVAIAQADASLNNNLYRYETGTSQAAPAVSGMLALMQEFFEVRLVQGYSPALLKGLVINSARSLSTLNPSYNYAVGETLNLQGWGLPNISNVVSEALGTPESPTQFIDQSPTNALATGDSVSFNLMLNMVATNQPQPAFAPLRITLVWTDPPGNPNAAVKLVNDLDLIVSNSVTGEIYVGNNFPIDSTFTPALPTNLFGGTNQFELPTDRVNNVESIVLQPFIATNLVITVRGARVNVNAVTAHSNNIVQDFALIVSTDAPYLPAGPVAGGYFTLAAPVASPNLRPPVGILTNGLGIVRQRVGANSPLLGGAEGSTNQWRFYVFTNAAPPANLGLTNLTAGSNVAFVTFRPPNLSGSRHVPVGGLREVAPRNVDADLDLYVSRDPMLTNLDLTVLAASAKSTNRGGTEFVVFSNGIPDEVFYVGVKSEDHQAAEFSLIALSTDDPFCQQTDSNNIVVRFIGIPDVADGDPLVPSAVSWVGLALNICGEITLQRAVLTNALTSELFGDTFAALSHADTQSGATRDVVLLSHNLFGDTNSGSYRFTFDDSGRGDMPGSRRTDDAVNSGGLNGLIGEQGNGVWLYSFSDNAIVHTTRVDEVTLLLEGRLSNNIARFITLCGGESFLDAVDIPPNATNFAINVFNLNGGPVEVYVRLDDPTTAQPELPTTAVFDAQASFAPPGGVLRLTPSTIPQLQAGRYYVRFYNPGATCIDFNLTYDVDVSSSPAGRLSFSITNGPVSLIDDAVSRSANNIGVNREVYAVEVGVRLDHPRVSDLALHLVSPSGTSVLLMENRGLQDTNGLGAGYPVTNVVPVFSNGGSVPQTNIIAAGVNAGTLQISFDFFGIPDRMTIYYDGALIYDSGFVNGSGTFSVPFGPGASTDVVIVMNEPAGNSGTAWEYTASVISGVTYLLFTEDTNKTTTPIKFAIPPFGASLAGCVSNTPVFFESFETIIPSGYNAGPMGVWIVDRPNVEVGNFVAGSMAHTGTNYLDLNESQPGQISTSITLVPGQNYALNFAYARNPDSRTLFGIIPQADIRMGGSVLTTIAADQVNTWANLDWITTSIVFTATAPTMLLELDGLTPIPSGVMFDTLSVALVCPASPPAYLPEESLNRFRGESTQGEWRLELWDTRVGAAITNGLISWDLRFVLTSPNAALTAIQLANCVTHTNTVIRGTPLYFFIDVPLNATNAVNTLDALTGSGLQLSVARFALPVGASPPDDYPPAFAGAAPSSTTVIMDTNTPPVLLPGSRYYLRVDNLVPTETNAFALTACIGTDTNLFPFTFAPLSLSAGVPTGGNIAAGLGINYYQVNISNDSSVAFFELACLNGNANLVVRRDMGGPHPLPTRVVYDYGSVNSGSTGEQVGLTTAQSPIQLTPGKWYLGVYNVDSQPVNYCVSVTQHKLITNGTPELLALDSPMTFTVPGGTTTTNLYRFNVDWVDTAALFEVYDVSGDVDLFVGQGQLPSPNLGGLSAARGQQPEQVVVTTNDYWWDISGEYWLAIANHGTNPASFTVRATVNTPEGLLLSAQALKARPDVVAKGKGLPITWNSISGQRYQIEMATEAGGNYAPYAVVTAKGPSTTFTDPTPTTSLTKRFFQVRQIAP